ncbi:hypothetical protein [Moraxella sp. ZY210820]|nr:hypothetical protein [Moraxella sp. ZY210820]WLF83685.1 hypothetical protein LU301_10575 [Moraxella sp. ZY210820]
MQFIWDEAKETFDDYPEFTQEDIDRAVFKVAGKPVDKATWQRQVKKNA